MTWDDFDFNIDLECFACMYIDDNGGIDKTEMRMRG